MSKQINQIPLTGTSVLEERLKRVEQQLSNSSNFVNSYTLGTLRTDRTTAPASSTDVTAGVDKLYDVIRVYPYEYILMNISGTAQWARISLSTF